MMWLIEESEENRAKPIETFHVRPIDKWQVVGCLNIWRAYLMTFDGRIEFH